MGGIFVKPLLIIPCFNESENILNVIKNVTENGLSEKYDYIIINDGSTDKTLEICIENNINHLDLSVNLGIGGAVQTGYMYAKKYNYDIAIQFDGDGQHDVNYLENLIKPILEEKSDIVIGSRFIDKKGFQSSSYRRMGIKILSNLIYILVGKKVIDVTSGFRACNKKAIELFSTNYPSDYPEPEAIVLAYKNDINILEVPVVMKEREFGKSSINKLRAIYYMVKVSIAIIISSLSAKNK